MTNPSHKKEVWASGAAYEPYVGRWSRLVAHKFLNWLAIPPGKRWLDVGCGTGALSQTILEIAYPGEVIGVDPSETFLAFARDHVLSQKASFTVGDAQALPLESEAFDAAVSGLVLNFIPQPQLAVAELARVTKHGGTAAAYVWDYADQMQMIRYFWDAAIALDDAASSLDEGKRFPLCQPEPLAQLFRDADLLNVEVRAIDIPTQFRDFDDYWSPYLGGQAPAPAYAMSLSEEQRAILEKRIRFTLPISADGSIHLIARAWAVRGVRA
jgi:SAM-dependent methyltransferase